MNATRTLATARRVLRQLGHDRRTVGLILGVPLVMMTLLYGVFDGDKRTFDSIGASLLGIFPLITMFLVTSIATLRERTSGTLERLLAMPLGKGDMILGYALAFGTLAAVQASLAAGLAVWVLDLGFAGSPWLLLVVALLDAGGDLRRDADVVRRERHEPDPGPRGGDRRLPPRRRRRRRQRGAGARPRCGDAPAPYGVTCRHVLAT